jgi:hypothetical protein
VLPPLELPLLLPLELLPVSGPVDPPSNVATPPELLLQATIPAVPPNTVRLAPPRNRTTLAKFMLQLLPRAAVARNALRATILRDISGAATFQRRCFTGASL